MPGYVLLDSDCSAIAAKYRCSICGWLLKDPLQTTCGHCCCRSCVDNFFKNGKLQMQCHTCGETVSKDQIFPDNFMKREVLALKVHCPRKEEGCNWEGEVRELGAHISVCDFFQVPCPHATCGMLVKKSDLPRHLQSECACRLVTCDYCGAEIAAYFMLAHLNADCPTYPVRCSKCNKEVQRSKLTEHQDPLRGDCEAIGGPCPFVQAGCPRAEAMSVEEMKNHLKDAVVPHLTLLLAIFMQVGDDVQSLMTSDVGTASGTVASAMGATASAAATFFNGSESTVRNLMSRVENVAAENRYLRKKLRDQSDRITNVERRTVLRNNTTFHSANVVPESLSQQPPSVEDVRHQNSYLQRQLEQAQETIRRLERRVESQDHMLALRNVALADLEEYIRQQEVNSYNGTLLWKISDFARRRNDARAGTQTSFYSACFYTSRHGYKMCARVYLNGDRMGKGTHLSMFFVVMRGQYDALLRWPFRQKVTLMLLDQDNIEHVIDTFRPGPNSSSFQRPQREMNIASGCPLFCPLSDLDKHAYVRDDTMFMKIIVDTSDL